MATTAATSVESFCNQLSKSRLLKPKEVKVLFRDWRRAEPKGSVEQFARWLVAEHCLTPYQVQQLRHGLADHLFLNHYKVLDLIGKGRMAGIFKASHSLGQIVAIKVMPAVKARDPQLLGRFQREARMAVRLNHPNAVRSYHMGDAGGRHYIVMEHLEGETLEEVLKRRGRLPYPEAVRLMHQAMLGLEHIRDQAIVHRDLKPANLMLVPPRPPGAPDNTLHATVKILDIGLGRILFEEGASEMMQLTTDGMYLGTYEYMAPEQAKNPHTSDSRADLYSLGCILYQALTGQLLFPGRDPVGQILGHTSEKPRPLRLLEPSVPEPLEKVVLTILSKDPNHRYATPKVAAQALAQFLPRQEEAPAGVSALTQSYLKWVESQPFEETNDAPPSTQRWFYRHAGIQLGPVTGARLQELAADGMFEPTDPIWMEGDDQLLAIPAKAAIDFSAKPKPAKPAAPAKPSSAPTKSNALANTGFDPATGQVLDPQKFSKWQREQRQTKGEATATTQELYYKARIHLDRWLDFERNRRPILAGDLDFIRQHPEIQRFMTFYSRFGEEMIHKLWNHLQFMAENRRKYYCALS